MRLKTFSAPNIALALARAREVMGDQAVIVSTADARDGEEARVTAALEEAQPTGGTAVGGDWDKEADRLHILTDVLDFHRLPPPIADPLQAASQGFESAGPSAMLAGALDIHYRFRPFDVVNCISPLVVVGPPGSGKTVACAKIAAASLLAERPVRLVNTDVGRAGTAQRLKALAARLSVVVEDAPDDGALALCSPREPDELVIVDSGGINPLDEQEHAAVRQKISSFRGEAMVVFAAGQDAFEAAEQGAAFAALGAETLIASRLDHAARYGGLLAAAKAGRLAIAAAGIRPELGDCLKPLNPMSLARILFARFESSPTPFEHMDLTG